MRRDIKSDELIRIQAEIIYAGLGGSEDNDASAIVLIIQQFGIERILDCLGEAKRIMDKDGMLAEDATRQLTFGEVFHLLVHGDSVVEED